MDVDYCKVLLGWLLVIIFGILGALYGLFTIFIWVVSLAGGPPVGWEAQVILGVMILLFAAGVMLISEGRRARSAALSDKNVPEEEREQQTEGDND